MTPQPQNDKLKREVERQAQRRRRAHSERDSLIAHTVFLGTLGVLFIVPVVLLAYLGSWLDGLAEAYSSRWTVSLILLGLLIGAINVWLYVREHT